MTLITFDLENVEWVTTRLPKARVDLDKTPALVTHEICDDFFMNRLGSTKFY